MRHLLIVAAALACLLPGTAALAQSSKENHDVCLQNNRIYGWKTLNDRTLQVSDLDGNQFQVHLEGGCVGLNQARMSIIFRTFTRLGCLGQGDSIAYHDTALGRMSCRVTSVEPYSPPPKGK